MSFFEELKRRNVIRVGFAYGVVGWVIAQVTDLALENFGAPEWVMKTVLFLMLIGFFVALFIAWAYELTPEGIKREAEVDPNRSIARQTGRKLDRLVIVVLLLAVAMLLSQRYLPDDDPVTSPVAQSVEPTAHAAAETTAEDPSVAVLPFVNMSSDPEQEYFSDGISEEILNVLTRIPNLKVAARTSSFQFKGKTLDIAAIGKQLGVNHILEGSVRKAGNTLRITAQLIRADTGFHLWSETFDRQLEDVFAIQDEIAATIAHELRTRFTTELDMPSTKIGLEAYELYLKGRGLVATRTEGRLFESIDILKAAIEIEPEYAPAMATLAKAYAVLPWFSEKLPAGEVREQARQWASRALEIEPNNAEALSILAIVYSETDMNWAGARRLLDKALQVNPGSVAANNFRGDLATRTGDLKNAMKYESRAAELDPLSPVQLTDLGNVYLLNGDYEETISLARRALALDPKFFSAYRHLANAYFALGDTEQLAAVSRMVKTLPDVPSDVLANIAVKLSIAAGEPDAAYAIVKRRAKLAKAGQTPAATVAFEAALLGDFDTAGELLLQAYEEKDGTWIFPTFIRLPEQAPDSKPWQEFWRLPGAAELAALRRSYGFSPQAPGFGVGGSSSAARENELTNKSPTK